MRRLRWQQTITFSLQSPRLSARTPNYNLIQKAAMSVDLDQASGPWSVVKKEEKELTRF
jgi:hypothetical protein